MTIVTGSENSTFTGTDTSDFFINLQNGNVINGGLGNDYIINLFGSSATFNGGLGDDYLLGFFGSNNVYEGGEGDDFISNLFSSGNTLNGGQGNDTLASYLGDGDTLNGGEGDDTLLGSLFGDDILNGGAGNDVLNGRGGSNTFVFDANSGSDIINGLNDASKIQLVGLTESQFDSGVTVQADGDDTVINYGNTEIRLTNIDSNTIDSSDFVLEADPIEPFDVLDLSARSAGDYFSILGSANNSLVATNTDLILNVDGNVTTFNNSFNANVTTSTDIVDILANEVHSTVNALVDNFGDNSFEAIRFSDLNIYFGSVDNDVIRIGTGDYTSGADTYNFVYSGSGDDILQGNQIANPSREELVFDQAFFFSAKTTRDVLAAGEGNDTIIGGNVRENLLGGNGDDTYFYDGTGQVIGDDIINDESGANDVIEFNDYASTAADFTREGNNLRIELNDLATGNSVLVEDYFSSDSIETIEFTDASLDLAAVTALV